MYYLVIKNLGIEKCIDVHAEDIWISGRPYECRKNNEFKKGRLVRRIFIKCIQNPWTKILATIWHD